MAVGRAVALYVLILVAPFYAGLGVFFLRCPFDPRFDAVAYARHWQLVDGCTGRRMRVVGGAGRVALTIILGVFGHLGRFRVRRPETYVRCQGKWLLMAGSGPAANPKGQPTPLPE